jgi:hypothetical protein
MVAYCNLNARSRKKHYIISIGLFFSIPASAKESATMRLHCSILTILTTFTLSVSAGEFDAAVKSFERSVGYVRPIATLLGTMTNQGWYTSASIDKRFGFYIGIPITLTYINDKDREFDSLYTDKGCVECGKAGGNPAGCVEQTMLTLPTIFGSVPLPKAVNSKIDLHGNVVLQDTILFTNGLKAMRNLNFLPYLSPQIGVSLFHTEVKLRYIGFAIDQFSMHMPGVGLQHDLASLLPPLPISLSVGWNMTLFNLAWTPGDNIDGSVTLKGYSMFAGALAGFRFRKFEAFLETGWEHATLATGGNLTITNSDKTTEPVDPKLTLTGRNSFRIGLNVAFALGYMPVLGGQLGANAGNTVNIIGYKYRPKK